MSTESLYNDYLSALLAGERPKCAKIVEGLIAAQTDLETLYTGLFEKSLYEIGDLWQKNKISVATEHLCTSITEYLMTLVQPLLFGAERVGRRAMVACVANEYHQIGGKMVADVLELSGWDTYFLGANLPVKDLVAVVEEKQPHLLRLSLSVYFNVPNLDSAVKDVSRRWAQLPVFVGGKAFEYGARNIFGAYPNVKYVGSLSELKRRLPGTGSGRDR